MSFQHLSVPQLVKLQEKSAVTLVDIRDQQSYLRGHIPKSQWIHEGNVDEFIASADLDIPLVVCCYHGNASQGAADHFFRQGFEDVYSLDGGFTAWAGQQPN